VVVRRGAKSRQRAECVVGEIRHRIGIQPGTDGVDASNGGRPTMITHKEVLRNLTMTVKAINKKWTETVQFSLKISIL
jgi:hypothetical protein